MSSLAASVLPGILFAFALASPHTLAARPDRSAQTRHPASTEIWRETTTEAVADVLGLFHKPGGVVSLAGCGQERKLKFASSGGSLGSALDAIVSIDSRYRWSIQDGVVVFLPVERLPALLNVRIREFDSRDADNVFAAAGLLLHVPEVRRAAQRLGIGRSPNEVYGGTLGGVSPSGPSSRAASKPLGVHCVNVTLAQALNAIVKANRKGVWVFSEWHCPNGGGFGVTFSGYQ